MAKKIITFILCLSAFFSATVSANPTDTDGFILGAVRNFYGYLAIGRDLSYEPLSTEQVSFILVSNSFNESGHEYTLHETRSNGDRVFRSNTATAVVYILSADQKKLARHLIWGKEWYGSIFYTSSEAERDKFYRENKHKRLAGISPDITSSSSFGSISNGSGTKSQGSSTCTTCGGTGIDPHRQEGTSYSGAAGWCAHYNKQGSACSICGSYSAHFHSRCASCNVPR